MVSGPGPRQPPGRRARHARPRATTCSVDLTDKAIEFIDDVKTIAPDRPVFLYYALGAAHAPHHVPREWADRYKGRFDMGYEAAREQILARQKELGIVPADTELPPINPIGTPETRTGPDGQPFPPLDYTKPWDGLSADERRLFARMAEVYAGFLSHADAQIGRLLDHLEAIEPAGQHADLRRLRQRRQRRGRPERLGQREQVLQRHPRRPGRQPGHARRAGRPEDLQPLPDRLGDGLQHARSRCGSATRSTAAPATRASSPGRPASPARGEIRAPVPPRHRPRADRAGVPRA